MTPYKFRFFSDFCSSEHCYDRYCNMYASIMPQAPIMPHINKGADSDWVHVVDDTYTHVIILNTAMPDISHIPKNNVIGLAFEPRELLALDKFIPYAEKHISRYFIGNACNLPPPFEEHYSYMWFTPYVLRDTSFLTSLKKKPTVSLMVSQKNYLPGHQYRFALAEMIIQCNLPIDIWGRGVPHLINKFGARPQLRGEFTDVIKSLYEDYKFSIAIENTQSATYISEKLSDCLVTGTIPIYLGAKNIKSISSVMDKSVIYLSGVLIKDIELLINICCNPDSYSRDIIPARNEFAENLNLFHSLSMIFAESS